MNPQQPQIPPQQPVPPASDEALKYIVPIGVSGYAIAAGYLGLFSVLVFPIPFAILFGILGLKDVKKHPEKRGKVRSWFGIGMAIFVVLFIIFAIIASSLNG